MTLRIQFSTRLGTSKRPAHLQCYSSPYLSTLVRIPRTQRGSAIYAVSRERPLPNTSLIIGPPFTSWTKGNVQAILDNPPLAMHRLWAEQYGHTYRYRLLGNHQWLYTQDPLAISHILSETDVFRKPGIIRKTLVAMMGEGLIIAEGHDHARQRRILTSAFSNASVRDMLPIFFDKAYELRDKLSGMIEDENICASSTPPKEVNIVAGGRKIDMLKYLGQTTLDIIGLAGFDYDFHSLSQAKNELAEAYSAMFNVGQSVDIVTILQAIIPFANLIPTKRMRAKRKAKEVTATIGRVGVVLLPGAHCSDSSRRRSAWFKLPLRVASTSTMIWGRTFCLSSSKPIWHLTSLLNNA